MTRKDYITIANAFKPFYQGSWGTDYKPTTEELIVDITAEMGKALKSDNPKFDPIKFLEYLRK